MRHILQYVENVTRKQLRKEKYKEMEKIENKLAELLNVKVWQIKNTIELINQGNTIPFIARYRKEQTGNLSDEQLREFDEKYKYLMNIENEKERITRLIDEQGKLTEELVGAIANANTLTELEDIYRPYKQKKKTRASIAKEKGLEPLALYIISQKHNDISEEAKNYINEENGINSLEDAISGASDIIAENISDNADYRKVIRDMTFRKGIIKTKKKNGDEKDTYYVYYDYNEPVARMPGHRILAINRGEKEDAIKVALETPKEAILNYIESKVIRSREKTFLESECYSIITNAILDSYTRLISASIERDIRSSITEDAETKAIKVFGQNVKNLIMQKPLKDMTIMGFDPAYRTGCKIAIIDETGKVLDTTTVYPTMPQNDVEGAEKVLIPLIKKHNVKLISLGNGTASRESEQFIVNMLKKIPEQEACYAIVSEAGASVYSASKLATEEYPDINVSIRGAISIARRLQDPMAELVKIDPKAIGVGQYQHDVNQKQLSESLTGVIEDSVNKVGVNVNTATPSLLSYVAGVSKTIASNIVKYREENGKFKSRKELNKVSKLGPAAFTQCAGFLRIIDGKNILDNTAVHPESYNIAEAILDKIGIDLKEYTKEWDEIRTKLDTLNAEKIADELNIGKETTEDIIEELKKPGRDVRQDMPEVVVKSDILKIEDLKEDMYLKGTVRNVTDFGAFVDIGIKNDGLVHISELSDNYIKNPMEIVQVGDIVDVRVIKIDKEKGKVSLSMKSKK